MEQERTYKWIQDRLRELHSGTLSEADRAQLEEIARQDEFVRDALEGYRSASRHDHTKSLHTLSHQIRNKGVARRRKLFPSSPQWVLQAVAASLVLILVTWTVIYYLGKNDPAVLVSAKNDIVAEDSMTDVQLNASPAEEDLAANMESGYLESTDPPGLRANAQAGINEAEAKAKAEEKAEVKTKAEMNKDVAVSPEAGAVTMETYGETAKTQQADQEQSPERYEDYSNAMPADLMKKRVTGQVLNSFGQPVIGAFVSIPNSNLMSTSDEYGQFEIFLPSRSSPVEFSSTGYTDTLVTMTQGQEDVVVMLQSLDYASVKTMTTGKVAASESKLPASKNIAYKFPEYLQENSKFPIQQNLSSRGKEVTLEFGISSAGRPENIRVFKSNADKKYSTESMRLVKEGPDWTCENDVYPCVTRYTIYFR